MTKYRKGPTKDSQKNPQRTAKEHYGLSCRKLTPIELNGALYSSARQDFSHAAGLSWEPALSDTQSVRRGRPRHLWTWKFHSSQSSEASALRRWLEGSVRACEGVAAWHAAINIYWWQPDRPALSRIQMLGRNWEVVVNQVPTAPNKKQKFWLICAGVSKWSFHKPP